MIEAGETTRVTTLTVTEDGADEPTEMLVLVGSVDGVEIGELTLHVWDAAVPALPLGGVLLLGGLLLWRGVRRRGTWRV